MWHMVWLKCAPPSQASMPSMILCRLCLWGRDPTSIHCWAVSNIQIKEHSQCKGSQRLMGLKVHQNNKKG